MFNFTSTLRIKGFQLSYDLKSVSTCQTYSGVALISICVVIFKESIIYLWYLEWRFSAYKHNLVGLFFADSNPLYGRHIFKYLIR